MLNIISKLNKKVGNILFGKDKTKNYNIINYWLSEAEGVIDINPRLALLNVRIANKAYNHYHPNINSRINDIIFKLGDYTK